MCGGEESEAEGEMRWRRGEGGKKVRWDDVREDAGSRKGWGVKK